MNILLTSVGRRNYMVEYFKEALLPFGGKVFALNSHPNAAGLCVADESALSPLIYDDHYKEFLLNYCIKNKISLVFSLFDIELPVLSSLKPHFAKNGIQIIVGDTWLTKTANDKWQMQSFLKKNGFETVPIFFSPTAFLSDFEQEKSNFPVFVKPRWGMGSLFVYKACNIEELLFYYNKSHSEIRKSYLKYESAVDFAQSIIIQEAMPGTEYGLDVINNLTGEYQTTIIKKKLAMRSGETDVAVTVDIPLLAGIGKQLAHICKHPAIMDVDVFYDGVKAYILEINPRFGGGYPFSHAAGVHLPKAIVNWHLGINVSEQQCLTPVIGTKSMKGITLVKSF